MEEETSKWLQTKYQSVHVYCTGEEARAHTMTQGRAAPLNRARAHYGSHDFADQALPLIFPAGPKVNVRARGEPGDEAIRIKSQKEVLIEELPV